MSILHKVRRIEAGLTRAVEQRAREWSKSGPREPLEIVQAIVDSVAERLEPAARGRYVFPYNRLQVSVVAPSRDDRARAAAVFDSEPTLRERISARLREAGCDPSALQIVVSYVPRPSPGWRALEFHVDCARVATAEAPAVPSPPLPAKRDLHVTIASGAAEQPTYVFSLPRVNLGRCREVRDSQSRLVRTNHVAFTDQAGPPNHSVSRQHAHIEYVEAGHYRLRDDRSAHGTSIVRSGRTIPVPAGSRGVRLESDDEVVLGEARLHVRIV